MKKALITIALLLPMVVSAHDIEVPNDDNVTIYYIWTNNETELAVSYQGSSYSSYSNEYSGNVVIPASVTYDGATYPVTSIGGYAFNGCSDVMSVTIPSSVTSIGDYTFSNCTSLTSIVVEEGNTVYDSRSNCNAIIESASNTLIAGCKNTIIPNSVTSIGYGAFYGCSGLTSVTIPNSVTSIGIGAFYGTAWYNNQPDGLVYAGKVAYTYKGTMPANTSISLLEGTLGIANSAFLNCSGLTSVTIPNSVTSIGGGAFSGCTGLTSMIIPNSVTSIGGEAFSGCHSLTSVTILNSVTGIGQSVFYGCI